MKKIDKRACRRVKIDPLKINPNHGLLYADAIKYVVRASVRGISGKRLLILCYFPVQGILVGKSDPKYVVFQGKDDFVTLEYLDDGKKKWRVCQSSWLDSFSLNMDDSSAFYSRKDELKAIRFCGTDGPSGFGAVNSLQKRIKETRESKRRIEKKKKMKKLMKPIDKRKLPRGLRRWVEQAVIPAHIFYDYRKGRKYMEGYCTRCKAEVQVLKPRHGKIGRCPNCDAEVTFHAVGRHSRVYEHETVQVVQHVGDSVVIRIMKINANFRNHREPEITMWESSRFLCGRKDGRYAEREFYWECGYDAITNWRNGSRPIRNPWFYQYDTDNCANLYPRNLPRELKDTPWQYCQVQEFSQHFQKPLYLPSYLRSYLEKPALEYLVKLKLFELARSVVYGNDDHGLYHRNPLSLESKGLQNVLGVPKACLPMLQRVNISYHGLYLLQQMIAVGKTVEEPFLAWCQKRKLYDDQDILRCLKYMSQTKLMFYLEDQMELLEDPRGFSHVFHLYRDYIRFCEDLGYDLKDSFVLHPRNIREAHDNASKMFDQKKVQIYNEKILGDYPALVEKYQMADKGLMMVPPKSAEEIVEEGQTLHHCVGGYVARVVNKECEILFLRTAERPDIPFFTVEVNHGRVAQVRGNNNCLPTPEVEAYMERWKKEKLLPAMQEAA